MKNVIAAAAVAVLSILPLNKVRSMKITPLPLRTLIFKRSPAARFSRRPSATTSNATPLSAATGPAS